MAVADGWFEAFCHAAVAEPRRVALTLIVAGAGFSSFPGSPLILVACIGHNSSGSPAW
jgi:hypothetical protein